MKKRIDWTTTSLLVGSHLVGIVGTGLYVYWNGVHPFEILSFLVLYVLTGLGITAGYHRYFSHRSYRASAPLRFFYLVFGAAALENSVLRWASDHRTHHKYVDTERDPYNIKQGGWHAHMGWIFYDRSQWEDLENVKDLESDPLVRWQDRYYPLLAAGVGFLLPCLAGALWGRPLGGLLWGGFARLTFVHHMTFFINSLAHMVGRQTYSDQDSSRDSGWLAFFTYGEGYHNFHHKFQADFRNGIRWYHWDPTKWLILGLSRLGLTDRLNRTPHQTIFNARLAMDLQHTRQKAGGCSHEIWEKIRLQIESHRRELELASGRWAAVRSRYEALKLSKLNRSRRFLARCRHKLKVRERQFEQAKRNWREILASTAAQAKLLRNLPVSE